MILLLATLAHLLTSVDAQIIVVNQSCVQSNEESPPCISIHEMANISLHFTSNTTTFYFWSGKYFVLEDIKIVNDKIMTEILPIGINPVHIYCRNDASISFTVKGSVRIEFMRFHNCAKLEPLVKVLSTSAMIKSVIINSTYFINSVHTSIDAISGGGDSQVSADIRNTTFINSTARAVMLKNVKELLINNCSFINNSAGGISAVSRGKGLKYGSNVTILDTKFIINRGENGGALSMKDFTEILIIDTLFDGNEASIYGGAVYIESDKNIKPMNIIIEQSQFVYNFASNGGGIYSETLKKCEVSFYLKNNTFFNNSANSGGAVYIYHHTSKTSQLSSQNSRLIDSFNFYPFPWESSWRRLDILYNRKKEQIHFTINNTFFAINTGNFGGDLYVNEVDVMIIQNSQFVLSNFDYISEYNRTHDNIKGSEYKGGAIYMDTLNNEMTIENCLFYKCGAHYGGAIFHKCVYSFNDCSLEIIRSDFIANVAVTSGGAIMGEGMGVTLTHSKFVGNHAYIGGAIHCNHGFINTFSLIMQDNEAMQNGGGLYLEMCRLHIHNESHFVNNSASKYGGVIFSDDLNEVCKSINSCSVSWDTNSIIFTSNNSANIGTIIYGGMIRTCCYSDSDNNLSIKNFQIQDVSAIDLAFSSSLIQLCFHDDNTSNCGIRWMNETVYPGQRFIVRVTCVNNIGKTATCDLQNNYIGTTNIHLGEGENSLTLNGHENLIFHAFSEQETFGTLRLTADIFCDQELWNSLQVNVAINKSCPLGFYKNRDRCLCDPRLQIRFPKVECDINTNLITITDIGWFGYDHNSLKVYNKLCPLNYCSDNKTLCPTCSSLICHNNHDGILCGGCVKGYSTVLGSNNCKKCPTSQKYNFVWLIIVIALAGIVLVMFLLLIKMTVSSGTTNGLIFFANIVSFSGLLDMMTTCSNYSKALRTVIAWINLDLGVEVCFFPGMRIYEKTWLQFAFPFYVWFLIATIIILSKYFSSVMKIMGRRNIEVLATLFLLSYAKLLKVIVTALSFTYIEVGSADNVSDSLVYQQVWVYDGNIGYLSSQHLPLFVVALIFFLFLFLPYTLLLLLGQYIVYVPSRKGLRWIHSTAISTVLDSYHAPYSKHNRYWTGLGLVVRCCLFAVFGTSYDLYKNQYWISIAIVLILTVKLCLCGKVYRSKFVDLLEIFYLLNLGVLSISLQYKRDYCNYLTASTTLSIIVFLIVLTYHVIILIRNNFKCSKRMNNILKAKSQERKTISSVITQTQVAENPSTTFIELREALLDN